MNKLSIFLTIAVVALFSGIVKGDPVTDTIQGIKSQVGYYAAAAATGLGIGHVCCEGYEHGVGTKTIQLNKPVFANNLRGSVGRLAYLGGSICAAPVAVVVTLATAFVPAYLWFVAAPAVANKCTGKSQQQDDQFDKSLTEK